MRRTRLALFSVIVALSLGVAFTVNAIGAANAGASTGPSSTVTTTPIGPGAPTFVGPAASPCGGCSLLSGPIQTSLSSASASGAAARAPAHVALKVDTARTMPSPQLWRATAAAAAARVRRAETTTVPTPPTVSCRPLRPGCEDINTSQRQAIGVKGLNAVDSGTLSTNPNGDIEPPDQGLCAGNRYVIETNNIGEFMVFNMGLRRESAPISLDTLMGLTGLGWSSGGDPSCLYDGSNGGHWIFTEIVSASSEANGGAFTGCFAGVADACYEGIAVSTTNNPFGAYNTYFLNADYNPAEPGSPSLLNDFAKIGTTRDSFEIFYDEFPLNPKNPGLDGGGFNGAQELAFDKNALETGAPTTLAGGAPNPAFNVAIENMGLLPTDSAGDDCATTAGALCWYQVIPAQAPDPSQFDNSFGGSGFMLASLDFNGQGDTRFAAFDWTNLIQLNNTAGCAGTSCSAIQFGGTLFSGTDYYYGEGFLGAQKAGKIPLGRRCGKAGLSVPPSSGVPAPKHCPEGGIATNGDGMTQAVQAQGQLWGAISTEVDQTFANESTPEVHQGALYFVIGTGSFDAGNGFSLTNDQYVTAAHEDIEFPTMAAEDSPGSPAILSFTLSGNGGPTHADNGGFYPSSAYGTLTSYSNGLFGSAVNVVDMGQAPQDGFTEYQGYPGPTRPRWGDYGWAVNVPGVGIYFASEYIQYPNCTGRAFTLTLSTCGGTRDGRANWGTSVNLISPNLGRH